MSIVNNVILAFSLEENEKARIDEVNSYGDPEWLSVVNLVSIDAEEENDRPHTPRRRWYGGSKVFEHNVFMGTVSGLDLNRFLNHLRSLNWEEPQNVQLIILMQDDEERRFKIYTL